MQPLFHSTLKPRPMRVGIKNVADYSPFGVQLNGRTISSTEYRYGFQNQEKDDEIKGEGNSIYFEDRFNDPRLARWMSVDPLYRKNSSVSTYSSNGNNPIYFVDKDGRDIIDFLKTMHQNYNSQWKVLKSSTVFMDWLGQFADITQLESQNLGYVTTGINSDIKISFAITTTPGLWGSTAIYFNGKNLADVEESALKGATIDDFTIEIELSSAKDTDEGNVHGDKLLTIIHELGLHGETQKNLLVSFRDGEIDAKALLEAYKKEVDGAGELDHLEISSRTAEKYEAMYKDVNKVFETVKDVNIAIKDKLYPNLPQAAREASLEKYYNQPSRAFSTLMVNLQEDFIQAYIEDQEIGYNPKFRGRLLNHLKKP